MVSVTALRSGSSSRISGAGVGPLAHVRLGDWCADLGALTTSFHAGPSIAVGVASSFEGRTGRKGGRGPLPNKPLQADEAATFNSEPVHIVGLRASGIIDHLKGLRR
jgi:hypothetical protein